MIQSATKRCSRCLQKKALTHFRLCKKGKTTRRSECNLCHRETEVARQRHTREKKRGLAIQKRSSQICQTADARRVAAIAEAMVRDLGGWTRFTQIWREILQAARKNKRYGRIFRMVQAIWRIERAAEELQVESQRVQFDRAEFALSISRSQMAAASVLTELGWSVEAPPLIE